ncbi:MAG: helix-turn-helix transcriptional regulator [Proteobacteria bacterium]|nr:helix-turn-helix transcriptional regulator [Pseudomonadota bacterium]MCP4918638.1 helix-turn-helix transcriptional regulator [Pseudomonadota bacterium]
MFGVFSEQGFGSVRMRQLAKTAGISIGKLYHYFPDKRALADRLFVHVGGQMIADAVATISPGETARDRLGKLSDFVERQSSRLSATLMLALDHRRLHPDEHVTRDSLRAYRAALTENVGVDDEILFSALLGMMVRHQLDPEDLDLEAHRAWLDSLAD